MRQMTLAHQAELPRYGKKTRREQFLEDMNAVMPWGELLALIEPHYPRGEMGRKPVPDETTILNFRHLLKARELCGQMLDAVNQYLAGKGIRITTGTIVDATIIHTPSSTKNQSQKRDPEVHPTRKGNQWSFDMGHVFRKGTSGEQK